MVTPFQGEGGALSTNGVGFLCAKVASNQRVRGGADMIINQMIDGRGEHPHLTSGISESVAEVQCRIQQDDLANACSDWSSELVTWHLDRLLDTASR